MRLWYYYGNTKGKIEAYEEKLDWALAEDDMLYLDDPTIQKYEADDYEWTLPWAGSRERRLDDAAAWELWWTDHYAPSNEAG